jgi:GT2 family glycosyltransferase
MPLMPRIRFSIIIATYNQRGLIKDAVDSALCQRNDAVEIIVVDDASTDGTQDVLRQYGDAIRLVCRETNGRVSVARNCGAVLATGEYLVFLDGDDALVPWALDVYERIIQTTNPKMIVARLWQFEGMLPVALPGNAPQSTQIIEYVDYYRKDRTAASTASALVVDRQIFQSVGGWSPDMLLMEDHDLAMKLGVSGRTILILAPPTAFYRNHANNASKDIPGYLPWVCKVIRNERLGKYPGGAQRRFQRHALIGGYILTWASRGIKRGLYADTLKLIANNWPMALAAVTRKLVVRLRGRKAPETLDMPGGQTPGGQRPWTREQGAAGEML